MTGYDGKERSGPRDIGLAAFALVMVLAGFVSFGSGDSGQRLFGVATVLFFGVGYFGMLMVPLFGASTPVMHIEEAAGPAGEDGFAFAASRAKFFASSAVLAGICAAGFLMGLYAQDMFDDWKAMPARWAGMAMGVFTALLLARKLLSSFLPTSPLVLTRSGLRVRPGLIVVPVPWESLERVEVDRGPVGSGSFLGLSFTPSFRSRLLPVHRTHRWASEWDMSFGDDVFATSLPVIEEIVMRYLRDSTLRERLGTREELEYLTH